jgi:mono/diheme cytochrome c family protein
MTKRLGIWIAAACAVVAGAVVLTLVAGGGTSSADRVRLDHGGSASRAQLDRVLNAARAVSASATRADLEAEGEELFNSATVAKSGESCVSCHIVGGGVNDKLGVITHGFPGGAASLNDFRGVRDAPALWDVGRTAPYNWVGSNKTLEDQVVAAITTHFSAEGGGVTDRRVAAVAAYLRTIRAPVTRHDQGRLTPQELRGEEVFVGQGGCIVCHGGPQFTDNQIHDTAVPQLNVSQLDGPANDPGSATIPHGFNTPQLRDVRNTAPYMHNGALTTLEAVVDFYNQNSLTGGPLGLDGPQKADLVAYLKTL